MSIPKGLMTKVYTIYASDYSSAVKFEETTADNYVKIKFAVPIGNNAITIEGSEGYDIPTSLSYILFAVLVIGAGIGSILFITLRKSRRKTE